MYYRRRIILSILEQFGEVNKTKFQKLLFLFTRNETGKSKKIFDFIPYKFGCYSFQADNDLRILKNQKLVTLSAKKEGNAEYWKAESSEIQFNKIKREDRDIIIRLKKQYSHLNQEELIRYTYVKFPFWAIKSKIKERLLSNEELEKINKQNRVFNDKCLMTIGYEGISLEKYINKLIINGVKVLCDVRKNSFSMKYGFSKTQLRNACESVNIKFEHIPQLGIVSEKRKQLKTMSDYRSLFAEYEKTVLAESEKSLKKIVELLLENNRIALTCFEKEVCMCHRGKIVEELKKLPEWNIPIKHL